MDGKTQAAAAAASGMSLRTAREWDTGPAPSATKQPRDWRTRPDPFARGVGHGRRAAVAERPQGRPRSEVGVGGVADALPGAVSRRARRGRCSGAFATGGRGTASSPRCSFEQVAVPGREAAIDFTHATDLGVTIAGDPFPHLLFEFVLSYSHWTWVAIAFGETFEALAAGVQGALWALGGVPAVLRSDNLSAATHELKASSGPRSDAALSRRARALRDALEPHHAGPGA